MTDTPMISDTTSLMSSSKFKTHKCSICDRMLSTRYNLERHMKTFHEDDSDDSAPNNMDGNENESDETMSIEKSSTEDNESERDDTMSEGDSSKGGNESETDEQMSEAESSTEESENSDDEDNHVTRMFRKLFIKAYCEHEDELLSWIDENVGKYMSHNEAIKNAVLSNDKAKKSLRHHLTQNIIDINEQRRHPMFKAIMNKAKELMEDGFDENEAIASAVAYRKHGIHNLIKFI